MTEAPTYNPGYRIVYLATDGAVVELLPVKEKSTSFKQQLVIYRARENRSQEREGVLLALNPDARDGYAYLCARLHHLLLEANVDWPASLPRLVPG